MKNLKYILWVMLFCIIKLNAQTQSENYIKTKVYKIESQTSLASPSILQANQSITYFDGLGRPIQKIAYAQSSSGRDIVTPIEYDSFGNQEKDYLPFVSSNVASLDYKTNDLTEVVAFYNNSTYDNTLNPFSKKLYESSPLGRVTKQAAPGNDWALNGGHEIKFDYLLNTFGELINFGVSSNGDLIDYGFYKPNLVHKSIIKNENWEPINGTNFTTQEFKDNFGRIVLKRNFENNSTIDTYYVYDTKGNLRFVLPPKFVESLTLAVPNPTCSFTRSIDYRSILTSLSGNSINGGGDILVTYQNEELKIRFNAGFEESFINTNSNPSLEASPVLCNIPNTFVGYLAVGPINYSVSVENNKLKLEKPLGAPTLSITLLNGTVTTAIYNPVASAININTVNDLCYQYKYDVYDRLVEKKIPGKQWEFIIYDKLDRVIATGPAFSPFTDAVAPNNIGWLITKYDVFNRPVCTGWKQTTTVTAAGRVVLQNQQNALTTTLNESRVASTTIDGVAVGYTNVVEPTVFKLLTANYYDDYAFPNAPTTFGTVLTQPVYYNNSNQKPKGMPTGSWVRVLETAALANAEKSYILYDYKARPIRSYMQNYLGGYTQTDSNLDFAGKTIFTETRHKRLAASTELLVREDFTYTPQDRLLTHTHKINGGVTQLMAKNTYNELGQLMSKNVGGTDVAGVVGLQKVDYTYNIRGWLTSINDIKSLTPSSGDMAADLFAFKINYNTIDGAVAGVKKLYNGNIAETYWLSGSDNILRKYGYNYDDLNRLRNAIYQKPESPNPVSGSYNESLTYDKNGNILHLDRFGAQDSDSNALPALKIDDLSYVYAGNSNQLQQVTDATNSPIGFNDGANTANDYSYDANGNLVSDENKAITQIVYNHLNLPNKISFANGGIITYIYNAMGQKVKKVVLENATTTTTDYITGYQYKNTVLQFFPTAEGYVNYTEPQNGSSVTAANYNYAFNYVDHLGNIRLTYAQDPVTLVLRIMEENHYYPFGLKHSGYNSDQLTYMMVNATTRIRPLPPLFTTSYQYKYNGKELQEELGLNFYDYGARNFDPALGRWMNIDPLAEVSRRWSPYTCAINNPVFFIDPDGMLSEPFINDLWNKSGNDTRWTNNNNRSFSSDNGKTADTGENLDTNSDDCPSSKTKEDWNNYYQQGENTADALGVNIMYGGGNGLTTGMYEDCNKLFYVDGELMDLRKFENRAHAFGSLISDAALLEAPAKIFKLLTKFLTIKERNGLLKAGNAIDKGGLKAVGKALQKHGSRAGSIFPEVSGNLASINAQGESILKGILTNPNTTNAIRHHARFGKVLGYRILGGQGARFSGNGKTFIGFLE